MGARSWRNGRDGVRSWQRPLTSAPPRGRAAWYTLIVERVARVFRSFEEAERADDDYYASLTPEERLDILLAMIERHRSSLGETAERFERVHCVVELSRG